MFFKIQCLSFITMYPFLLYYVFLSQLIFQTLCKYLKEIHFNNNWVSIINCTIIRHYHCVKNVRIRNYSSPHFPAFGPNTEKYFVHLCFQSKCRKMRNGITPNTDTSDAVYVPITWGGGYCIGLCIWMEQGLNDMDDDGGYICKKEDIDVLGDINRRRYG